MAQEKMCIILLVEDDPADQKMVRYALDKQDITTQLEISGTGEQAIEYLLSTLNGQGRPGLILLDLNMPGMGGMEFLKEIKSKEEFCDIPVVIVSTSDSRDDIENSYKLNAAGYVKKSTHPKEFAQTLEKIIRYWFDLSERNDCFINESSKAAVI